jgi:uncharacterized protein (DUF1800 family)
MAFGATPEDLDRFVGKSPAETVDQLLGYDPDDDPLDAQLQQIIGLISLNRIENVQDWWFFRMMNSPRPAQERVALFWHNHFATSAGKVDQPILMHNQIELFRKRGLGSFRELLVAVTRDPAMLIWLDGRYNRKGKPNENYGREVMELFTLGIGNYTENDVKQLARAFTGWSLKGTEASFDPKQFDDGSKEIFGQHGTFNDEQAVGLLLTQPAAPRFIARSLLKEFVHPHPTEEQVNHYAGLVVAHDWEIKPVLQEMLTSRLFYSEWAYRAKIKSPVDIVIGGAKGLPGAKPTTSFLRDATAKMGQNLLYPPTVKGWDGEESWINANTVLLRFNFGLALAEQRGQDFAARADLDAWLKKHDLKSADDIINHFTRLYLDGRISGEANAKLQQYVANDPSKKPKPFELTPISVSTKIRGILHLIMSMPEFQLA